MHKSEKQEVVAEMADDHTMKDESQSTKLAQSNNMLATNPSSMEVMAKTNVEAATS